MPNLSDEPKTTPVSPNAEYWLRHAKSAEPAFYLRLHYMEQAFHAANNEAHAQRTRVAALEAERDEIRAVVTEGVAVRAGLEAENAHLRESLKWAIDYLVNNDKDAPQYEEFMRARHLVTHEDFWGPFSMMSARAELAESENERLRVALQFLGIDATLLASIQEAREGKTEAISAIRERLKPEINT